MRADRPASGEELGRSGRATPARQAATVILVRGGATLLEVLLVQRNPGARFMPGAWVFPGGAVDAQDGAGDAAHRLAAVRELREEAGVSGIEAASLVRFSRWITPPEIEIRFDTHFFLAVAPEGVEPRVDGEEAVDLRWVTPAGALEARRAGALLLVFPTIKHLEQLAAFPSADALLAQAAGREIVPVMPRIVTGAEGGEHARIVLPHEPDHPGA